MQSGYLFEQLSGKIQKVVRVRNYDLVLLNSLIPMVKYQFPEDRSDIDQNFLEMYRLTEGVAGIWKMGEDKFTACHVSFAGEPDSYGIGKDAIVAINGIEGDPTTITKTIKDWRNSEELVVIFNNATKSPDLSLGIFSDMLTEADVSMMSLIKAAKRTFVPVVGDEKEKTALEEVLKKIDEGEQGVFVDKNILAKLFDEDEASKNVNRLDITDPTLSDKIQYLSQAWDNILSRFYSFNGMSTQSGSKMAQQSVEEINNGSSAAMIIPDDRLEKAIGDYFTGITKANRVWGWNATAELSECWRHEAEENLGDNEVEEEESEEELDNEPEIDDNKGEEETDPNKKEEEE